MAHLSSHFLLVLTLLLVLPQSSGHAAAPIISSPTIKMPVNKATTLPPAALPTTTNHAAPAPEPTLSDDAEGKNKISLPRFGVLRFTAVNMRTGPGTRYPITWVYRRTNLPVEVISLFDTWYRIRDYEGTEGWVHKTQIKMQRRGMITGNKPHDIHASADANAAVTAHLMPNVLFNIQSCTKDWCLTRGDDFKGYLRKDEFFGAYANEVFE